ncbi:uncharacterized protein HMPREF1541_06128 [Cyphellophora europaea CBS 101466]|uniref:Uncharacterized protein n=1 Tax=Cyphellophora europaea (strain CBS 101466) TaxID=1220924 RepID=W2RU09_CYPE1|nr:uncharacterized protein HMPREF1541_06128 [Cyphellophora europaea CBS 101466]ETN39902.1 hypothetical protein HMPREF1541_06128 [Cyphellophora europaea CBS 101466]
MSLTVRHLNADTSFLLIFSPEAHPVPSDFNSANGAFSVLVDPWLVGDSVVTAPWFAITKRVIPSAIQHLSQIEEPDVVVVSQNKPDHCHRETLLQLRPEAKTIVAAEPGAARAIKSWNHFDPNRIHGLTKFDPKTRFGNSFRVRIPPLSPRGHAGEVCISFIPAKNYLTGLHNAFGITYIPPTHHKSIATVPTIDLPKATRYFHIPMSPVSMLANSPPQPVSPIFQRPVSIDVPRDSTRGHRPQLSRSSNTASSEFLPLSEQARFSDNFSETKDGRSLNVPQTTITKQKSEPSFQINDSFDFGIEHPPYNFNTLEALPTPPDSPQTEVSRAPSIFSNRKSPGPSHQQSISSIASHPSLVSPVTPARPKPISIIYSPHGLPFADLQPYIRSHLVRIGALPLTLLLHSFDHAQNPWYLGGNIMSGAAGGAKIARALMARCWISAHDEEKDDKGVSVKQLKVKRCQAEDVHKVLWAGDDGEWLKQKGWTCDVRSLDVGKEMFIGQARDLLAGMEGKRESRLLKFGVG